MLKTIFKTASAMTFALSASASFAQVNLTSNAAGAGTAGALSATSLVERVPDGQFVPLGTIDQRQNLNVHEGLWGQEALPHVAFKDGREVRKQGGASELV